MMTLESELTKKTDVFFVCADGGSPFFESELFLREQCAMVRCVGGVGGVEGALWR